MQIYTSIDLHSSLLHPVSPLKSFYFQNAGFAKSKNIFCGNPSILIRTFGGHISLPIRFPYFTYFSFTNSPIPQYGGGRGCRGWHRTHIHLWIMPFPKTRALSKPICKEKFPWNCFVERLKLCPPPPPTTLRNRKGQAHSLFEILAFSVVDTRDYLVMWMVKQILYHQSELSLNVNTIISSILIGDPKFANTIHVSEFDKGWDK